jgi:hypothetical protein
MVALRTRLPARIASRVCWLKPVARINARTPAAATRSRSFASAIVVRGRYSIDVDRNTQIVAELPPPIGFFADKVLPRPRQS